MFALSLTRGRAYELQEIWASFLNIYGVQSNVISTPLPWIMSGLSRSASVSYAGWNGSDAVSRIHAHYFETIFLQVNNLVERYVWI